MVLSKSGFFLFIQMAQIYKPCLFKKITEPSPVHDSMEWGIYIKSVPFKVFPDLKDVPSRDWPDENGDEEYIPDLPYYKAYEIECQFVYIGSGGTANDQIRSFLKYLSENGMYSMYDTYTGIGRRDVRYVGYSEDILYRKDGENDIVVFSVTMKVNNPIEEITLTTT